MELAEFKNKIEVMIGRSITHAINFMTKVFGEDDVALDLKEFLVTVPLKIEFEKFEDEIKPVSGTDIIQFIGGYTQLGNYENDVKMLQIHIVIRVPIDPDQFENFLKLIDINTNEFNSGSVIKFHEAMLMVYMHEMMHILFKHLSPAYNQKLDALVHSLLGKKGQNKIPDHVIHRLKNFAEDFFINSILLEKANGGTSWNKLQEAVEHNDDELPFLYNPELSAMKDETVETIIEKLISEFETNEQSLQDLMDQSCQCDQGQDGQSCQCDQEQEGSKDQGQEGQNSQDGQNGQGSENQGQEEQGSSNSDMFKDIKVTEYSFGYKGKKYKIRDLHDNQVGQDQEADGKTEAEIENAMRGVQNQIASKTRGTGAQSILSDLGIPIEVTVDWLEKIDSELFKEVRRYTRKQDISWRKLKNKYRHIAHLPSIKNYETEIYATVIIDQSGSMSDIDIRKINFITQKLAPKCKELRIIVHDYEIIKDETFRRKVESNVKEFMKKRYSQGGTSHKEVFESLDNDKKKIGEHIVLVFSDMYSDIDGLFFNYDNLKNYNWYWVYTEDSASIMDNIPGKHINMETGKMTII